MRYPLHRCPLRTTLCKAVDDFLLHIQRLPSGYAFWYGLPAKGRTGRHALRKRLVYAVLDAVMSPALQRAMVLACFDDSGKPLVQAQALRHWLLVNLYNSDHARLSQAWYALVQGSQF